MQCERRTCTRSPIADFIEQVLFSNVQNLHATSSVQREQQLPEPPQAEAPPHSHPTPVGTTLMSAPVKRTPPSPTPQSACQRFARTQVRMRRHAQEGADKKTVPDESG